MALTQAQLQDRAAGIGSSDVAAILGRDPWRTANDVRLEKLGLLEPEPAPVFGPFGTEDMRLVGTHTEAAIATLAAQCLGVELVQPDQVYIDATGILRANVDRQVQRAEIGYPPVECKDYGIDEGWGEPGTAEVPDAVLAQVAHQMICVRCREAYVARLGRGFRRGLFLYHIDGTDEGIASLIDELADFLPKWHARYIVNREPLPDTAPPAMMSVLRRVRREPKSVVTIDDALALRWRCSEEDYRTAEEARELNRRHVLAAIGTAEAGRSKYGTAVLARYGDSKQLRWKAAK